MIIARKTAKKTDATVINVRRLLRQRFRQAKEPHPDPPQKGGNLNGTFDIL